MLPSMPPVVEALLGLSMADAVLNALNTRLDAETIDHGKTTAVIVDLSFVPTVQQAHAQKTFSF